MARSSACSPTGSRTSTASTWKSSARRSAAYLIIGIFWAGLYALAQAQDHHAISSTTTGTLEHGDLLYFSYTTLTTTGFGDLAPRSPVARMWSVLEAVVGTFYNAIVIARLVTLYPRSPLA